MITIEVDEETARDLLQRQLEALSKEEESLAARLKDVMERRKKVDQQLRPLVPRARASAPTSPKAILQNAGRVCAICGKQEVIKHRHPVLESAPKPEVTKPAPLNNATGNGVQPHGGFENKAKNAIGRIAEMASYVIGLNGWKPMSALQLIDAFKDNFPDVVATTGKQSDFRVRLIDASNGGLLLRNGIGPDAVYSAIRKP